MVAAARIPEIRPRSVRVGGNRLGVTLRATPTLIQSVYWQTGMLTYTAPLLLLTVYAGFLGSRVNREIPSRHGPTALLTGAGLPFLIAGFSETSAALIVGALALATVTVAVARSAPARTIRPSG
jgi:hypothetical protein